jgi:hypothetical protein
MDDKAFEPGHQALPRLELLELVGEGADRGHFADVDALDQVLAGREVPVERRDPDPSAGGDIFERGVDPGLGERLTRRHEDRVEVPCRVGTMGALFLDHVIDRHRLHSFLAAGPQVATSVRPFDVPGHRPRAPTRSAATEFPVQRRADANASPISAAEAGAAGWSLYCSSFVTE